jgi:hypothetical protein
MADFFSRKNIITAVMVSAIIFSFFIYSSSSSDIKLYLATKDNGILVSENSGSSWSSFNKGLPDKIKPLNLYKAGNYLYITTYNSGIFRSPVNSSEWENISSNDFRTRSIYRDDSGYRTISAFNYDRKNPDSIVIATKHNIYHSPDRGETWKELTQRGLHERNYITALAVSGKKIYAGTSFNGIYEFTGSRFIHSGKQLPGEVYSGTLTFTEQVTALYADSKNLYSGFFFGSGVYSKKTGTKTFQYIQGTSDEKTKKKVDDISAEDNRLFYTSEGHLYRTDADGNIIKDETISSILDKSINRYKTVSAVIISKGNSFPALSTAIKQKDNKKRSDKAGSKNAIYLSVSSVKKNLKKYLKIADETEINAFVIDMKDDFGNIYFQSKNKTASEIKSLRSPVNVTDVLAKMKKHKIYSIARIVVFKDNKMYRGYGSKYAIKNRRTGKPWKGTDHEYWVDPYSEFVQNYNIELAVELEKLGFDEIQFDYIRFPSDGPIHLCNYTHRKESSTYKSEIMIDFLTKAKNNLNIPVSVDIYGFNSWYHFGNWIGQDMEAISHVVDVICPMVYPSHFGKSFYMKGERKMRSYRIVYDGGLRAVKLADNAVHLRPYLQAFNLLSPTWGTEYITNQINAASKSGLSGYTLWNAGGDYETPHRALKKNEEL